MNKFHSLRRNITILVLDQISDRQLMGSDRFTSASLPVIDRLSRNPKFFCEFLRCEIQQNPDDS